jgi:hypothetical protein
MTEARAAAHLELGRRRAARGAGAERLERRCERLASLRLALFSLALAVGAAAAWAGVSLAWTAPALVGFAIAVALHGRTRAAVAQARRSERFYDRALARMEHRFAGAGRAGDEYAPPEHAYATQLDLFGAGSVFELLCGARTRSGERALARFLCGAAPPEEIGARQAAAEELAPLVDWRERIATLGPELRDAVDADALATWGSAAAAARRRELRAGLLACNALVAGTLGLWWLGAGALPLVGALAVQSVLARALRGRVEHATAGVDRAARQLELLSGLLAAVERAPFRVPKLVALRRAFETDGAPPSRHVARLARLVDLLDSPRNAFFAPIAFALLWTPHVALGLEAWRARTGTALGTWMAALGELEALVDLAAYRYAEPDDAFPEVAAGDARFEAVGLGHPLIPGERCVTNDVSLGPERRLLVISGSNMSGKSTLLRSVGVAAVLAQAGAPVRARSLRMSPLAVGASLVVVDSLAEGASHFYAEITALRRIAALCDGPVPPLFLLDELLQGTNSRDRRLGAEAVVRHLLGRGALGLVTTHDLALCEIAEALAPRAANAHFEDGLAADALHFDYRLRPGVVTHGNALALMRAVGLPV